MKIFSPKILALREAVAAIIKHNRRLGPVVRAGLSTPGLPRLLNCECNSGHKYIEDMITAVKALPRGTPEAQIPLKELNNSSVDLLLDIGDVEEMLPPDTPVEPRRALRHAVQDAMNVEDRFTNFTTGISGASPNIAPDEYCHRLDLFVRDIKDAFAEINKAISDIRHESGAAKRGRPRSQKGHCRKGKLTARMQSQLRTFKTFLVQHGYKGEEKKVRAFAAQCWKCNPAWKNACRNKGQNKGYASPATLANAFLNTKG